MVQLTQGAILDTYNNKTDGQPILQVMDVKKIPANTGDRFRLVLSDGVHYQQAMLATQMNHLVESNQITQHSIVQLTEYICNVVSNRRIVILLAVNVVEQGNGELIGSPQNVEHAAAGATAAPPQQQQQQSAVPSYMNSGAGGQGAGGSNRSFHPIASLNPYQNRWVIKARVTSKGQIRTWHNDRGEGKLFSVDFLDKAGGQIRATMFNDACDKFFPIFQEKQVYIVSGGQLKMANKKFSHVPNEYELTLNADASVEFVGQDDEIETQKFDFVGIDQIEQIQPEEYVDIVGIVQGVTGISNIKSKAGKELTKRVLTLTDASLKAVDLTLWGETAEKYNEESLHQVIAIKTCRVSDFGGRSLSSTFASSVLINPDHKAAHDLRAWYDNQGKNAQVESISSKSMGGGGGDKRKTFQQVKEERLGFNDKPDYFVVKGTVTFFRHEMEKPPWYEACPSESCNKKVTLEDGLWHCVNCSKNYPAPVPRYILSLMCCDSTGSSWLTAFNEVAQKMLGKTASEVAEFKEQQNEAAFESVFQEANFKSFMFKIRAKKEDGGEETRVRSHVLSVDPVDFRKESMSLLQEIEAY